MNEYVGLAYRDSYNLVLQHVKRTTEVLRDLQSGGNFADTVFAMEAKNRLSKAQVFALVNSLLVQKYMYSSISFNLIKHCPDFHPLYDVLNQWNRFDIVIAYHHPQLGLSLINPMQIRHFEEVSDFTKDELVVVYAKPLNAEDSGLTQDLLQDCKKIFNMSTEGDFSRYHTMVIAPPTSQDTATQRKVIQPKPQPTVVQKKTLKEPVAEDKAVSAKKPTKKAEKPKPNAQRKMTPKYSCQVTNEFFHNGNVEAWKSIIESYELAHSELKVFVYHESKRVNNLNSLFKWGKVKNGDVILFAVAGENFKNIAKLHRYLFEGASNRFTVFAKKDVHKALSLF